MSDVRLIGEKYYDFGCSNQSFIDIANELKNAGVKNYYFMLRVNNPRTADVDPFSDDLTEQDKKDILVECVDNIWFFLRVVARKRIGENIVPFELNRGLAAALWCFERSQDFCLNEQREADSIMDGPILWAYQLAHEIRIDLFNKGPNDLIELQYNIDVLPPYWLKCKNPTDTKTWVPRMLSNDICDNMILPHSRPISRQQAEILARGITGSILYFSRIENMSFFTEIMSNSAPLYLTISEQAKASGRIHCRIISIGSDEPLPVINTMIPWIDTIYDMTDDELSLYKSSYIARNRCNRKIINIFYIKE